MVYFIAVLFGLLGLGLFYFFWNLDRFTVRFQVKWHVSDLKGGQKTYSQYLRWESPVYNRDIVEWATKVAIHYIPKEIRQLMPDEKPAVAVRKDLHSFLKLEERVENGDIFLIYVVP